MQNRRFQNRRGITLLFVVSMIVLFLLMGTTFVIVSSNFRADSVRRLQKDTHKIEGAKFVQQGLNEIIRGTSLDNSNSLMRGHSILEDMYGYGFTAFVEGTPVVADVPGTRYWAATNSVSSPAPGRVPSEGQLIEIDLTDAVGASNDNATSIRDGSSVTLVNRPGEYNSQIMTFLTGAGKGISARIVDYQVYFDTATPPNVTARKFVVLPFLSDSGSISLAALEDARVIVNRRAFGGVGAGFYTAAVEGTPNLSAEALNPNRLGESLADLTVVSGGNPTPYLGNDNGPNESWDAPDFQNMFLAGFDSTGAPLGSFHRPSLGASNSFDLFGSGLNVDSDNDGTNDAIWMDNGHPVQTTGNGLYYKPLVAYYVIDLDSRINLNTAGTLSDMLNAVTINDNGTAGTLTDDFAEYLAPPYAGQGIGPAEISPALFLGVDQRQPTTGDPVAGMGASTDSNMDYEKILVGDADSGIPGRYGFGADGVANSRFKGIGSPLVPGDLDEVPGDPFRDDWSTQKFFGYPTGAATVDGFFASSPFDTRGRFAIGTLPIAEQVYLDLNDPAFNNGLPATRFVGSVVADDSLTNSPYESNFAPSPFSRWEVGDDDTPFSAKELEVFLRKFDVDSNLLPGRLRTLTPTVFGDDVKRKLITTDSYEVPMAPLRALTDGGIAVPLLDVLRGKIRAAGAGVNIGMDGSRSTYGTAGFTPEFFEIDEYIQDLLSPEIFAGLKMNVNRPFGDGYDNDGNDVADEISEIAAVAQTNTDQTTLRPFDLDNDFTAGTNDDLARLKYARHLYVLALLVTEDNVTGMTVNEYRTAIAQWAINAVDFRDQDSINTPFEFDLNPWNGWDVNGDLTTQVDATGTTIMGTETTADYAVVWGVERPELLITESFGFHDRRTEDLDTDVSGEFSTGGGGSDLDWDNRLVPQTAAFIELYHPWTQDANNQILPSELALTPGAPIGVDLTKLTPVGDPVWRIGVKRLPADPTFLRSIVFNDPVASSVTDGGSETFYTSLFADIPVIEPGMFAVIGGSGNSLDGSAYRTTIGRRLTATEGDATTLDLANTRSISLDPTNTATDLQIIRNEWNGTLATPMMETNSYAGIAVVIDSPRSLSLSDRNGGYPMDALANPIHAGSDVGDGWAYTVPLDEPLDSTAHVDDLAAIWNNGTTDDFRTLYLQRLANPLVDWNAVTNPYLTVDIATLDLLSFNGVNAADRSNNQTNPERSDGTVGIPVTNGNTVNQSTQRGESQTDARLLFAREFGDPASADDVVLDGTDILNPLNNDQHNFSFEFVDSLGRTNDDFIATGGTSFYAWLTWNNRPFVNQYELANVPYVSQEELTSRFTLHSTAEFTGGTGGVANSPFDKHRVLPGTPAPASALASTFGHLLNFHGHDDAVANVQANLYRLFDYTEVPSPYVGTEMWLNTDDFANYPYNYISHYRNPGKININTIPDAQVYNALMGSYVSEMGWMAFNASRWKTTGGTEYSRAYRDSMDGSLAPPAPAGPMDGLVEANADCGLFRRADPAADTESIFDFNDATDYQNATRSAYFKNAMRQRLGNLTTTRSSVFAIWVTVGYFEANPDGTIKNIAGGGDELGVETGEVKRSRGFMIFDRSIPMAFEPGQDHNISRGILVQSIIE